jgi:kynureninase
VIADGTTVDLYKLGSAALAAQHPRRVIVTDDLNFPSDRFVAESLARQFGGEVRWVRSDPANGVSRADVAAALGDDVALVMLSHVDYRSGAICDLPGITADAHDAGALVLADLCHSVGVVPAELDAWGVDLAVGCTYKYLNGGPGSPAFLYVRQEHQARLVQPIWGWFGNKDRFAMGPQYAPADGITGWLSTSPSIVATAGIEASVELMAEVGISRLREKSAALTSLAVELFEQWLRPLGFELGSPADPERRGAQVSVRHPDAASLVQLLQEADVVADFRMPDVVRMAFAPAYTRFVDVWDGFDRLRCLVTEGRHLETAATA